MSASHLTNVVATPLWGVCIFGARSGRRTAPWLQRVRIYEMARKLFGLVAGIAVIAGSAKLLAQGGAKKPGPAANVKPSVTGVFKGNGKEAKLAHVSAHWREPFSDKPSMVLVFIEKDHSKNEKPDFDAGFGKFGSALIISLHEDGDIFGCEVDQNKQLRVCRRQSAWRTGYRWPGRSLRRDLGG